MYSTDMSKCTQSGAALLQNWLENYICAVETTKTHSKTQIYSADDADWCGSIDLVFIVSFNKQGEQTKQKREKKKIKLQFKLISNSIYLTS